MATTALAALDIDETSKNFMLTNLNSAQIFLTGKHQVSQSAWASSSLPGTRPVINDAVCKLLLVLFS